MSIWFYKFHSNLGLALFLLGFLFVALSTGIPEPPNTASYFEVAIAIDCAMLISGLIIEFHSKKEPEEMDRPSDDDWKNE